MHSHLPFIAKSSENIGAFLFPELTSSLPPSVPALGKKLQESLFTPHPNLGCLRHSTAWNSCSFHQTTPSQFYAYLSNCYLLSPMLWNAGFPQSSILFLLSLSMPAELNWIGQAHPFWSFKLSPIQSRPALIFKAVFTCLLDVFIREFPPRCPKRNTLFLSWSQHLCSLSCWLTASTSCQIWKSRSLWSSCIYRDLAL